MKTVIKTLPKPSVISIEELKCGTPPLVGLYLPSFSLGPKKFILVPNTHECSANHVCWSNGKMAWMYRPDIETLLTDTMNQKESATILFFDTMEELGEWLLK